MWKYIHVFQLNFEYIQLKVIYDDVSNLIHLDMNVVTFPFVYLYLPIFTVIYLASTTCHTLNSVLVPCDYWKKQTVFQKWLCMHPIRVLSMFLFDCLLSVSPLWPGVCFSLHQLLMDLSALSFLDRFFIRYAFKNLYFCLCWVFACGLLSSYSEHGP